LFEDKQTIGTRKEIIMADHPLAGMGGKPLVGIPTSNQTFVGRIIIELFENSQASADANGKVVADASGMALSVSLGLGSSTTKAELVQRISAAFPVRATREIQLEERRRKIAEDKGGIY